MYVAQQTSDIMTRLFRYLRAKFHRPARLYRFTRREWQCYQDIGFGSYED